MPYDIMKKNVFEGGGVRKLRNYKGGLKIITKYYMGGVKNEAKSHYVICEWPQRSSAL